GTATLGQRYQAWLGAFVAVASILLLLAAYKFLPGQMPNAQSMMGNAAYAQCLHDTRLAGGEGCLNFGYPRGSPKPFGLPVNLVADAVFGGDGQIDPGEVRSVYAGFLVLAVVLAGILFAGSPGAGGWACWAPCSTCSRRWCSSNPAMPRCSSAWRWCRDTCCLMSCCWTPCGSGGSGWSRCCLRAWRPYVCSRCSWMDILSCSALRFLRCISRHRPLQAATSAGRRSRRC